MATVTIGDFPLDMREYDSEGVDENDELLLTDTTFSAAGEDGFTFTYTGTGFVDNDADDVPDTGTIQDISVTFEGDPVFLVSGLNMDWPDYWNFVALGDQALFLNTVFGSADTITGSSANDYLIGLGGNDTMSGGGGKDTLDGGKGKDDIEGGNGKDKLIGGAQQDTLAGDAGADMFVFGKAKDTGVGATKHDIITDFSQAQGDVIDLRKMNSNDDFHLGGDTFTNSAGEIIKFLEDEFTVVQGDIDGNGVADFEIILNGSHALESGDFSL